VGDGRARIEKQIRVLEDFETKYRAYLADVEHGQGIGEWLDAGGPVDDIQDEGWTVAEAEARKRELSELAPAADRAMRDSGVGVPGLARSWAQGGGPMATALPSLIFYHGPVGLDESGTAMQRQILELIPAAIGALRMKLEDPETSTVAPPGPVDRGDRTTRTGVRAWLTARATEIAVGVLVVVLGALAVAALAHFTSLI
jgi:hypothetical protein